MASETGHPDARERRAGHLAIIGGNEDRDQDKRVLQRFVELAGRASPRVVVLCAADEHTTALWAGYHRAFAELGVSHCTLLSPASRDQADSPAAADRLLGADAVLVAGDDARHLHRTLAGTALHRALASALDGLGRCVGATGAAAGLLPEQRVAVGGLAPGLGLMKGVLVVEHFSERHRLQKLLTVVAGNTGLLGVGVDEDTALLVQRCGGVEVVGDGAVTLVDGRGMVSQAIAGPVGEALELVDARLHLLPAGTRYGCDTEPVPATLSDAVGVLTGGRAS